MQCFILAKPNVDLQTDLGNIWDLQDLGLLPRRLAYSSVSTCGHTVDDMRVTAIKQFNCDNDRKLYERNLITKIGSVFPYGLS